MSLQNSFRPPQVTMPNGQTYTKYGVARVEVHHPTDPEHSEMFEIAVNICEGCGALVSGLMSRHDLWHAGLESMAKQAHTHARLGGFV